ncbi:OmpA family protein [Algoriphagus hitonicola]|uniref:OmpA-OmpF porin, OOP family n=1 Tax=Algoriphagus hitonicola TaxID=435880 RepID=A0A1I2VGK5_9BACT|nr:OmpA family protein [Algoriphagus hitonicola]SFG88322.1 OmpA-OmpF porin, OOP family [Algoriphagus hitonicola]
MKKLLVILALVGAVSSANAQKEFNRWSLEINSGFNKPMGPLTPGFLSPTLNIGHVDFGTRYMFNEYFGIKGDIGFGNFNEAGGDSNSPSFSTNYSRINLQGIANIGRLLNFQNISPKLTILGHFGTGGGRMKFEESIITNTEYDYHYNFITGISPQYLISNRVAMKADISVIINGRQTYTFDGNQYNAPYPITTPNSNPFVHATGTWWTGTLGLSFYLGKHDQHADWYLAPDIYVTKDELQSQIGEIKDMLKDSDGDGIPDYLDKEPNTPADARVNSQGTTLDSDKDGTPDHLDKCPFIPGPSTTDGCPVEEAINEVDYLKKAINDQYLNVYFSFDSSKPLNYSISSVQFISNFLKRNPDVNIKIKGYADELGGEDYNLMLSEKRAMAVYQLLKDSGINESRLSFKGYGEDTSVDKSSSDARKMARRVSFEVQ